MVIFAVILLFKNKHVISTKYLYLDICVLHINSARFDIHIISGSKLDKGNNVLQISGQYNTKS